MRILIAVRIGWTGTSATYKASLIYWPFQLQVLPWFPLIAELLLIADRVHQNDLQPIDCVWAVLSFLANPLVFCGLYLLLLMMPMSYTAQKAWWSSFDDGWHGSVFTLGGRAVLKSWVLAYRVYRVVLCIKEWHFRLLKKFISKGDPERKTQEEARLRKDIQDFISYWLYWFDGYLDYEPPFELADVDPDALTPGRQQATDPAESSSTDQMTTRASHCKSTCITTRSAPVAGSGDEEIGNLEDGDTVIRLEIRAEAS